MGAEQEKVVNEFLSLLEGPRRKAEAMSELLTEDVVFQINVPASAPVVGRELVLQQVEWLNKVSQDLSVEVRNMASNDRAVFVERVDSFTMEGKPYQLEVNAVFEVSADRRIAARREYFDSAAFGRQIGVDAADLRM
jgi:limonene-1,2-epoxide hydrolase